MELVPSVVTRRMNEDGRSEFVFLPDISSMPVTRPIEDRDIEQQEVGIFATREYKIGEVLQSDVAIGAIPVGHHRRRVCWACFCVSAKVKVKEGVDACNYCSLKCLQDDRAFLDRFGDAIQYVHDNNKNLVDIFSLVFRILHTYEGNVQQMENLEQLYSGAARRGSSSSRQLDVEEIDVLDTLLDSGIVDYDASKLEHMLRICRFNAQQLRLALKLTDTYILALMPKLSRLNHSCSPNTILTAIPKDKGSFVVDAIACSTIHRNEEVHMSYLRDVSMRWDMRKLLLKNFSFECRCQRCKEEKRIDQNITVHNIQNIYGALEVLGGDLYGRDASRNELYTCQDIALKYINSIDDQRKQQVGPILSEKLAAYYILAQISGKLGLRLATLSRIELLLAGCHTFLQAPDVGRVSTEDRKRARFLASEAFDCLSLLINCVEENNKYEKTGILADMLKVTLQFRRVLCPSSMS